MGAKNLSAAEKEFAFGRIERLYKQQAQEVLGVPKDRADLMWAEASAKFRKSKPAEEATLAELDAMINAMKESHNKWKAEQGKETGAVKPIEGKETQTAKPAEPVEPKTVVEKPVETEVQEVAPKEPIVAP